MEGSMQPPSSSPTPAPTKPSAQQNKIAALTLECAQLEQGLSGEDPKVIVQKHIELLHTYNERKDATQIMIGKIASIEQCTVKEVSERLGTDLDD